MKTNDNLLEIQALLDSKNQKQQMHLSQFCETYLQFFKIGHQQFKRQRQQMLRNIQNLLVFDNNRTFRKDVFIRIINASSNYQFIDVEVTLGYYIFPKITILHINGYSPTHSLNHQLNGNFGKVYRAYCYGQQIAIKCCQYSSQNFNKVLSDILKQYCLARISSSIGAGPYFSEKIGYHIVIYKDCIQFSMEYCELVTFGHNFGVKGQQQLKESIKKLHLLNICHLDLKHENICFSPKYQRFIFIDYGLSLILSEDLGQKTLTKFIGTHYYCGQQMKRLQRFNEGFVDLYYNDVCGLTKIFQTQKSNFVEVDFDDYRKIRRGLFQQIENITSFHVKYLVKFEMFKLEMKKAKETLTNFGRYFSRLQKQQIENYFNYLHIIKFKNNKQQENNQNSQSIFEKLSQINIMNSPLRLDYFIEQRQYQINILQDNQYKISWNQLQHYLQVLSRGIKINSAKYSLQEKRLFCLKAVKVLQSFNLINEIQFKENQLFSQIKFITSYLLEHCFNPISAAKYSIFCTAIFNSIVLETINSNQTVNYLAIIISSDVQDFTKLKMVFQLYKSHVWLYYTSNQYKDSQRCKKIMISLILEFLKKPNQIKQISVNFKSILSQKKIQYGKQCQELSPQIRIIQKRLLQQIEILNLHENGITNLNFYYCKQGQKRILFKQLRKIVIRSYSLLNFSLEYYHLAVMMTIQDKRHEQVKRLLYQYYKIFPRESIRFFTLELIRTYTNIQNMTKQSIKDFIGLIIHYKNAIINRFSTSLILYLLQRIYSLYFYLILNLQNQFFTKFVQTFLDYIKENNFQQDDTKHQIPQLLEKVKIGILFNQTIQLRKKKKINWNKFKDIFSNKIKSYYFLIRKNISFNISTQQHFCIFNILFFLLYSKSKFYEIICLCRKILPIVTRATHFPLKFYQNLSHLINMDPYFKTFRYQILSRIYSFYLNLLSQNNSFFSIFKKQKMYFQIFEFMYEYSSAVAISQFTNRISKCLLEQKCQQFSNSQITIFTLYAWLKFKDAQLLLKYKKKSLQIVNQIQPISSNPYNSLFFYRVIIFKVIEPSQSLFIQIFKSFGSISLAARKYIYKMIFQKFLNFSFLKLQRKKIRKLLIIIVKQSELNISKSTFFRLLCKDIHKKSVFHKYIKDKLKMVFQMEFDPSFQINAYRSYSRKFDLYIDSYLKKMERSL